MKKLSLLLVFISSLLYSQDPTIGIQTFATGFSQPLDIQHAGDDRLFIVEQSGNIRIANTDGTVNTTDFLSINVNTSGNERGLLGLAFHPDYATNGFFFVNYINSSGDTRISRFTVSSSNPDIADPSSEFIILEVDQPFSNHNAGGLAFGDDGFLYLTMGDGGNGGDPGNRAQNTGILLGKILRIDIDNQDAGLNYSIPDTNPFVGNSSFREEIWHYGLRNPFRLSFDPETGGMWIGDVGQNAVEEINFSLTGGQNFGWRCYEGNSPFNTSGCPPVSELTFPVTQYQQTSSRRSIVGGHVYRGSDFPTMEGLYFFSDTVSNEIIYTDAANPGTNVFSDPFNGNAFVSFGVDQENELYIAALGSGTIFRVVDTDLLAIDEFVATTFSLFPNPASDRLEIALNQLNASPATLVIYDITGKQVQSTNLTALNTSLNISNLKSGIYLVQLGNTGVAQKLIIE